MLRQHSSIHASRQSKVGKQQANVVLTREDIQRGRSIGGFENPVTQFAEAVDGVAANVRLVLDDEDSLAWFAVRHICNRSRFRD